MPLIPVPPRVPGLPDPLRRVPVPSDLAAVTTRGYEDEPASAGMEQSAVEDIWCAAERLVSKRR
jgi:hypothetical protein